MHQWLITRGTFEDDFHGFLKGNTFASWRGAEVEVMIFLVSKPCFKFFKNTSLLILNEAFKLVWL
jgi:hypothetical protein